MWAISKMQYEPTHTVVPVEFAIASLGVALLSIFSTILILVYRLYHAVALILHSPKEQTGVKCSACARQIHQDG